MVPKRVSLNSRTLRTSSELTKEPMEARESTAKRTPSWKAKPERDCKEKEKKRRKNTQSGCSFMEIHDFLLVARGLLDGLTKERRVGNWGETEVEVFDFFRRKFNRILGIGDWFGEIETKVGGNVVDII